MTGSEEKRDKFYDIAIVGSGPAGITASIYAARYGMTCVVVAKDYGLMGGAYHIENYPGYDSILGLDLLQRMIAQAKKLNVEIRDAEVI